MCILEIIQIITFTQLQTELDLWEHMQLCPRYTWKNGTSVSVQGMHLAFLNYSIFRGCIQNIQYYINTTI